jgi:hypothetical protein
MGVVGIWCMHFIGYVLPYSLINYLFPDLDTAIALSPLAMDVIHCNSPTLQDSRRFLCSCL